jgi:hypothetical protein
MVDIFDWIAHFDVNNIQVYTMSQLRHRVSTREELHISEKIQEKSGIRLSEGRFFPDAPEKRSSLLSSKSNGVLNLVASALCIWYAYEKTNSNS